MIESRTTRQFREAFASLPEEVRQHARRAYGLFRADPHRGSHHVFRKQGVRELVNLQKEGNEA